MISLSSARAFTPRLTSNPRTRSSSPRLYALGSKGGGAVLDRPGFLTGGDSNIQTDNGDGSQQRDGGNGFNGGGAYRVLLLDAPHHTEESVVKAITTVVGTDEQHAINCYYTSKSIGMAVVTSCLLEIAEFYAQQLYRMKCRATIEPDTTVV